MSHRDGAGKKSGVVRKTEHVHPRHQRDHLDDESSRLTEKPDFDERDRLVSPNRKASGPQKKHRRSPASENIAPATPDVDPQADQHGKNK